MKKEEIETQKLVLNTMKTNLNQINDFLKSDEAYCYYYFMKYMETKDEIAFNCFKERYEKLDNEGKAKAFTYIVEGLHKKNEVMAPEKSKVKNK